MMMWKNYNKSCRVDELFLFLLVIFFLFMAECKISSLNLNGARDPRKRASVYELIKLKSVDICFVQETHSWTLKWTGRGNGGVM